MSEELNARIASAIRSLAENTGGATLTAIASQPDLMTLGCVIAETADEGQAELSIDVAAAAVAIFLERAADSLEDDAESKATPNRAKAARAALGLLPGTQDRPLRGRRGRAGRVPTIARWLACGPESVFKARVDARSHFDALIGDMADHLTKKETAYKVGEQHRAQLARRAPLESAMRIDWLTRFEFYYKMWAPASGIRHDLERALRHLRRAETADAELFTRKSLYYYAEYLAQLERFTTDFGGLWILPNTTTEDAIADACWLIREPVPLSEIDESILRLTLTAYPELAPFIHATFAEPYLQPIVRAWRDWIHACKCARPRRPRKDCEVHKTVGWITLYMDALDEQWDFLADWYQRPRPGTVVDPLKIAEGAFPPPPSSKLTE
jgi:hypothetical protein